MPSLPLCLFWLCCTVWNNAAHIISTDFFPCCKLSIQAIICPYIQPKKKSIIPFPVSHPMPSIIAYLYIPMDVYVCISYVLIRTAKREIHPFSHFSYCTYSICCPVVAACPQMGVGRLFPGVSPHFKPLPASARRTDAMSLPELILILKWWSSLKTYWSGGCMSTSKSNVSLVSWKHKWPQYIDLLVYCNDFLSYIVIARSISFKNGM